MSDSSQRFLPGLAGLGLVCLLAEVTQAIAVPAEPAAVALAVNCASGECMVSHAGQKRAVRALMPLYADDVVTVAGKGSVEIGTSDRQSVRLDSRTGSYRVKAPVQPDGVVKRMWTQFAGLFTEEEMMEASASARAQPIHPPPMAVCGASGSALRLAAGERPIALALREGAGPFRLTVRDGAGKLVAQGKSENTRWLVAGPARLSPGKLTVTVEDTGAGTKQTVTAEVVAEQPSPPATLTPASLSAQARQSVRLMWMTSEAGGAWSLQAASEAAEADPNTMPAVFALKCGARR
jgi:hypothetical protein